MVRRRARRPPQMRERERERAPQARKRAPLVPVRAWVGHRSRREPTVLSNPPPTGGRRRGSVPRAHSGRTSVARRTRGRPPTVRSPAASRPPVRRPIRRDARRVVCRVRPTTRPMARPTRPEEARRGVWLAGSGMVFRAPPRMASLVALRVALRAVPLAARLLARSAAPLAVPLAVPLAACRVARRVALPVASRLAGPAVRLRLPSSGRRARVLPPLPPSALPMLPPTAVSVRSKRHPTGEDRENRRSGPPRARCPSLILRRTI